MSAFCHYVENPFFQSLCSTVVAFSVVVNTAVCLAQQKPSVEQIPASSKNSGAMKLESPNSNKSDDCTPVTDLPLRELTVDTQPESQIAQQRLKPNSAPTICAAPILSNSRTVELGTSPSEACTWPLWPGAQFCHRPLYFEEPCLERCGYVRCCQPVVSTANFFCNAALLPLKMYRQPCCSCEATPPAF